MDKVICVYSSSSCAVDRIYFDAAEELGKEIATRGDVFLFGGGLVGLMGASAKAVHQYGGCVIGVIPQALNQKGIVYEMCDELIETPGMRERKAVMDSRSDAFIALPGGYGTLEELLEIITLKQLRYHNKPVVILNINGFFQSLLEQFECIVQSNFAKEESLMLYKVASTVGEALDYIDSYQPHVYGDKWLTETEKGCRR